MGLRLVAPWWEMWGARMFGKRHESRDGNARIVYFAWRGKIYVTDWTAGS
jgi:hypothetical protein